MFEDFGEQSDRCPACGNVVLFGLEAFRADHIETMPDLVVQAWTCPWCEVTHIQRFSAEVVSVKRSGWASQRDEVSPHVLH